MKKLQFFGVGLAVSTALLNPLRAQIDLNAPVTDHPTVATEIKRGIDAAFDCSVSASRPVEEEECAFKAQSDNEQRHSSHDAYDAGLYFQVWMDHEVRLTSDKSIAATNSLAASYLEGDEKAARSFYPVLRATEIRAGLTDEQILSVLTITARAKDEVRKYLQIRKAEIVK